MSLMVDTGRGLFFLFEKYVFLHLNFYHLNSSLVVFQWTSYTITFLYQELKEKKVYFTTCNKTEG